MESTDSTSSVRFAGGVFAPDLPGGRAGAQVHLSDAEITATTPDGQTFALPYSDLALELGGASGRMIFCRGPDRRVTIFSEDKKFATALKSAGGSGLDAALQAMRAQASIQGRGYKRRVLIGAVIMAVLGVGAFQAFRAGTRAAVHALPMSVDKRLGEIASASVPQQGTHVSDPVVVGAIEKMVKRLSPHAREKLDFDVTVLDAPIVNAFCLPGGKIVVFTGLLREATEPEQVAAVLGHEMAHATLRHGLERIAQSIGLVVGLQVLMGDIEGLMALAAELGATGMLTSFGRDQETAADGEGLRMAHAAGIDGSALARFFETLERAHGDVPDELAWLSSHPQLDERRAEVTQQWQKLGTFRAQPLEIDWDLVQRRARDPQSATIPQKKAQDDGAPAVDTAGDRDENETPK